MKPVRYPHNIERPPFPHNGRIPAPGSDLREDMLTCDNCWFKQKTNPSLECVLVHGRRACLRCQQSRVKCSRNPDDWKKGWRRLTEEEELVWKTFGRLPNAPTQRQGSRPATSKRTGGSGTARPRSKSRDQSKAVAEGKSKASRSKATKGKEVKTTGRKSKKVEDSEEEDDEDEDDEDVRPAKRSRHDAGPSRPPTIWITGGRKVHDGPNPPNPVIRRLQLQQEKMETRLDLIDSHFNASTVVQQQMLEALERMSLSLQRLERGPSSNNAPAAVPITRRLQHLEATNNALFAAVNGMRESSGSRSSSTSPAVPSRPSLATGHEASPPPLPLPPRISPGHRVVAEVQTSPLSPDATMLPDFSTSPRFAVAVQTSPPLLPVHLMQEVQTEIEELTIPMETVAIQVPSTPPPPPPVRLDVEIQTTIALPGQTEIPVHVPVTIPNSFTLSQGTNVETEWSQSVLLGTSSPLTSLSAFDLPPSLTPQPMPASQDWSESVPSDSPVPVQPALRRSTRAARGGHN